MTPRAFWWCCGIAIAIKLWLVGGHDLIGKYRIYDDFLFLELSQHILNGDWLGPLHYRTLIKGPGYPLFIAGSYWLGLPLLLAQQLLYVIACTTVVLALSAVVKSRAILYCAFLLLLFNPFSYFYPMVGALMRESVYNSFALMFFGALLGIWYRHHFSVMRGVFWALVAGMAYSMIWLTREEAIWSVPGLVLFALVFVPKWPWQRNSSWLFRLVLVAFPVCMSIGAVFGVMKLNERHYGTAVFIETKSDQFVTALGSLMNIREDGFVKGKIVGPKSERAAFRVSPTFASIEPHIKKRSRKRPNVFYNWTLRSAANDAGYYSDHENVQPALDFYSQMGREIIAACEAGEIQCFDRSPTLQPPLHLEHKKRFPAEFLGLLKRAVWFDEYNAFSPEYQSFADMGMLLTFDYVTGHSAVRKSKHFEAMQPDFDFRMQETKEGLMQAIGTAYQWFMPALVFIALLAHLISMRSVLRFESSASLPLFGLIVGGSITAVLVILTYVKVTLFDVDRPITVLYGLIILYAVISIVSLLPGSREHHLDS